MILWVKKTFHAWNGSSDVDYMLADESLFHLIQSFKIHNTLSHLSDHCPFSAILNLYCNKEYTNTNRKARPAPKNIKWNQMTAGLFKLKLSCNKEQINYINEMKLDSNGQIELAISKINKLLSDAADINVNRKPITRNNKHRKFKQTHKPWFTEKLSALKKSLKKAGEELVNNHTSNTLRQRFFKLKKIFKMEVKQKKRQFKQSLYDKLVQVSYDNPKEYWELFDKLQKSQSNDKIENNECPIKDEEWVKHYSKLLGPQKFDESRLRTIKCKIEKIVNEPFFSELDYAISINEVMEASKSLRNNKAAGLDCINNEMVKCSLSFFVVLFRNILMLVYVNNIILNVGKLA